MNQLLMIYQSLTTQLLLLGFLFLFFFFFCSRPVSVSDNQYQLEYKHTFSLLDYLQETSDKGYLSSFIALKHRGLESVFINTNQVVFPVCFQHFQPTT